MSPTGPFPIVSAGLVSDVTGNPRVPGRRAAGLLAAISIPGNHDDLDAPRSAASACRRGSASRVRAHDGERPADARGAWRRFRRLPCVSVHAKSTGDLLYTGDSSDERALNALRRPLGMPRTLPRQRTRGSSVATFIGLTSHFGRACSIATTATGRALHCTIEDRNGELVCGTALQANAFSASPTGCCLPAGNVRGQVGGDPRSRGVTIRC